MKWHILTWVSVGRHIQNGKIHLCLFIKNSCICFKSYPRPSFWKIFSLELTYTIWQCCFFMSFMFSHKPIIIHSDAIVEPVCQGYTRWELNVDLPRILYQWQSKLTQIKILEWVRIVLGRRPGLLPRALCVRPCPVTQCPLWWLIIICGLPACHHQILLPHWNLCFLYLISLGPVLCFWGISWLWLCLPSPPQHTHTPKDIRMEPTHSFNCLI